MLSGFVPAVACLQRGGRGEPRQTLRSGGLLRPVVPPLELVGYQGGEQAQEVPRRIPAAASDSQWAAR